jgi:hypothetical protein
VYRGSVELNHRWQKSSRHGALPLFSACFRKVGGRQCSQANIFSTDVRRSVVIGLVVHGTHEQEAPSFLHALGRYLCTSQCALYQGVLACTKFTLLLSLFSDKTLYHLAFAWDGWGHRPQPPVYRHSYFIRYTTEPAFNLPCYVLSPGLADAEDFNPQSSLPKIALIFPAGGDRNDQMETSSSWNWVSKK